MPAKPAASAALLALLLVPAPSAALEVEGSIFQDATWTAAASPYVIRGDVTVLPHVTLTLEPGTVVQTPAGDSLASGVDVARSELIVQGVLVSAGTADQPVVFGSGLQAASTWYGIRILSTRPGTRLSRTQVRGAHFAVRVGADQPVAIDQLVIRKSLNGLLWESPLSAALTNVDVADLTGYGVRVQYPGDAEGVLTSTLFGLTVANVVGHGIHLLASDNAILQQVSVSRATGSGIRLQGVGASTVTRSVLSLNGSHGLELSGGALTLNNSLLYGNFGSGLDAVLTDGAALQVVNNTIDTNAFDGIHTNGNLGDAAFVIQNNIVTNNYSYGVRCQGGSLPATHTNNVWGSLVGDYSGAAPDAWSISANPLFRSRVPSGDLAGHPTTGGTWHRVNVNWQSSHNYSDNEDHTWNASLAGLRRVRVHLARIHLAANCAYRCSGDDYLYLRDHANANRASYRGDNANRSNQTLGPIDTLESFRLVMDVTNSSGGRYWGVQADYWEGQGVHSGLVADYRLQPGSPCADTGTGAGAPGEDLGGGQRPIDGDFNGEPRVDMGAWEFFLNVPPVADAGEDRDALTEDEVLFDAGGSVDEDGEIVTYAWTFGDGASASGPLVTHVYDAEGVYTVRLTVTDDYGDSAFDEAVITIAERPPDPPNRPPTAVAGPDLRGEVGAPIGFDGSGSSDQDGQIATWQWSFGDGRVGQGEQVQHTYDAEGQYTAILVVTDDDGASASDLVQVEVSVGVENLLPVADAGDDRVVHHNVEATFDAGRSFDPDGRIALYEWDFGDGEEAEGLVVTHTFDELGTYEVRLTVTDARGAQDSDTLQVRVNAPPFAHAGSNREVTMGQEAMFSAAASTDEDGEIVGYRWDFGDGETAEGDSVRHTWERPGSYFVRLVVTDDDGATDDALILVTVLSEGADNLPPSAEAGPDQLVHHGDRVVLSAADSTDADGRIVAYDWEFGDGNAGAGVVVTHTYEAPGAYQVSLVVQDDAGAEALDTTTVRVNARPLADAGPDVLASVGEDVSFDGSGSSDDDGNLVRYAWEFGDATGREGVRVSHQYAVAGSYLVRLTVRDDRGAEALDLALVRVEEGEAHNIAPTADAGDDQRVEVGEAVTLSGDGSEDADGRVVSYHWRFGDGETADGIVARHAYDDPGRYVATLVVTDDDGAESSDTATIDVNAPPIADAGPHRTVGAGDDVVFDGGGSRDPDGDVVAWEWDFDDGEQGQGETVTHAFDEPGSYLVRLVVTDDDGSIDEDVVVVAVTDDEGRPPNQGPVADAGGDLLVQLGERALFVGAASFDPDGRIASYGWDFGDGGGGEGPVVHHVYGQPGPYVATLAVTDDRGARATDQAAVTVNAPPVANAGDDVTGTSGVAVELDGSASRDPDGSVTVWRWEFGDGTEARGAQVSHAWAVPGTYLVRLTVTDNRGAEASDLALAAIDVVPSGNRPPVADAGADQVVQAGEEVVLSGAGSDDADGEIVGFAWDLGDGGVATGVEARHVYAAPGSYRVTLTVTDDAAATDSDTTTVRVNAPPTADAGPDRDIVAGERALFDASGSDDPDGRIVAYQWDFGDGSSDTGALAGHVYGAKGSYTVGLTVTDDDGASAQAQATVEVDEGGGGPAGNEPPVADAGGDRSVNAGEEVVFSGAASDDADGVIVSWLWDFGDGGAGSGLSAAHTYRRAGTFTVTLTVQDDARARAQDTAVVTVNAPPVAVAGATVSVEVGQEVLFDGSGSSDADGDLVSYHWELGDGSTVDGASVVHTYAVAATYTATLTVTDDGGATASATRMVVVTPVYPPVPESGGCALAGAATGAPAPILVLVLFGAARRRRARRLRRRWPRPPGSPAP